VAEVRGRAADRTCDPGEHRSELGGLGGVEVADVHDVPDRLDDGRRQPERPDAMFDGPVADRRDAPTGHALGMVEQLAGHAGAGLRGRHRAQVSQRDDT